MSRISLAFFIVAPIYGLVGMTWGSVMGALGDHSTLIGHAHLNLLGWVSMGIMGAFYGLAGDRAPAPFAWANFGLSNLGVLSIVPAMVMLTTGHQNYVPLEIIGDLSSALGLLTFFVAVLITARRVAKTAAPEPV